MFIRVQDTPTYLCMFVKKAASFLKPCIALLLISCLPIPFLNAQTPTCDDCVSDITIGYKENLLTSFPSPTAAGFSKVQEIPVDLYNGTSRVSIPLYSFGNGKAEIPLTLTYISTGFRVHEVASRVGLGWNLTIGGAITRVMKGLPDDLYTGDGYFNKALYIKNNLPDATQSMTKAEKELLDKMVDHDYDTQPDRFILSTPTVNGEFFYTDQGFVFKSRQKVKIQVYFKTTNSNLIDYWEVTDAGGIKYTFTAKEESIVYAHSFSYPIGGSGTGTASDLSHTSAWYLTKIEHPQTSSDLLIEYSGTSHSYSEPVEESAIVYGTAVSSSPVFCNEVPDMYAESAVATSTAAPLPSKIRFSNDANTYVAFSWASRDDITVNGKRLSEIRVYKHSNLVRKFSFGHSYFVNGAHKRLRLDSVTEYDSGNNSLPPYSFTYNTGTIPDYDSKAMDHWGYYNGQNNSTLVPTTVHDGNTVFTGANRNPNAAYAQTAILTQVKYPTGAITDLLYEGNTYSYVNGVAKTSNGNIGGVRIKQISYSDGSGATSREKVYSYTRSNDPQLSSGNLYAEPAFASVGSSVFYDGSQNITCGYLTIGSSAPFQLGDYTWNQFGYNQVTEKQSTGSEYGKTVYRFEKNPHKDEGKLDKTETYDQADALHSKTDHDYVYGTGSKWAQYATPSRKVDTYTHPFGAGGFRTVQDTTWITNGNSMWEYYDYLDYTTQEVYNGTPNAVVTTKDYVVNTTTMLPSQLIEHTEGTASRTTLYSYFTNAAAHIYNYPLSISVTSGATTLTKTWTEWTNNSGISPGGKWRAWKSWQWKGGSPSNPPSSANAVLTSQVNLYDTYGNPLVVEDAGGHQTKYYYGSVAAPFSQNGHNGVNGVYLTGIERVKSGANLYTKAGYNSRGELIKITDENNDARSFTYDSFGRLKETYNPNGERISRNVYYYSLDDNPMYNPADPNRIETITYNTPADTTDKTLSVSYLDGLGRPIQSQVRGGTQAILTETRYNDRGLPEVASRPILKTGVSGYVADLMGAGFAPDPGVPSTLLLPATSQVEDYYDTVAPTGEEDYAYSYTQYEASPLARVEKSTLPGSTHKIGSGKEVETTWGLNTTETFTINGKNWGVNTLAKTVTTDPSGKETIAYTDGWGRTIVSGVNMNPGGDDILNKASSDLVTYFEYDLRGNLVRVEDPRGLATTYSYNPLGQLTAKKLPDQDYSVNYKYDEKGRLRFTQDPNQKSQENDLSTNVSGNPNFTQTLVVTTDGTLSYDVYTFDFYMGGYTVRVRHQEAGNAIIHSHYFPGDDQHAWSATVAPGTYTLEGVADDPGEPIAGAGGTFAFTSFDIYTYTRYDELDRPTETGRYYGAVAFASANANDQNFPASGHTANLLYYYDGEQAYEDLLFPHNQEGRLTKLSYRDLSVATTSWGHTWYSYNSQGLIEWMVQDPPGVVGEKRIEYEYDELGRMTKRIYQRGLANERFQLRYSYDGLGRLAKVESSTNDGSTWTREAEYTGYLADGSVGQLKLGNSAVQTVDYTYTVQGWLDKINNPASIGTDKFAMDLAYTDNGNISSQQWRQPGLDANLASYGYSYDNANRLTAADFAGTVNYDVSYTYDKNGNIERVNRHGQYGYDYQTDYWTGISATSNRIVDYSLAQIDYIYIGYDASGNLNYNTQQGINSIDYDWRSLPAQTVTQRRGTMHYAYDGEGNRVRKELAGGAETHYVRGAGGEVLAVYENGSLQFHNILAGADIIGTWDGSQRRYFLKDHLGSIRTTVDQSGNVDGYDDYYPFGLTMPGRSSNSANPNDNYKYIGEEQDDEAGLNLYNLNARNYDPVIARFMQVDPLFDHPAQIGLSPYNYSWNNPINLSDPTGECPSCWEFVKNTVSDFWASLGFAKEEAPSASETINRATEKLEELEPIADVLSAVVPGASLVDPRSSDGEKALDVALEAGGTLLPGVKLIKHADDAASVAVKFSDEVLEFTQGTFDNARRISARIPEGFKRVRQKGVKGKVYTNGSTYISPDLDGHKGGIWKGADSIKNLGKKETRLGTYDENLRRIGD